MSDFLLLLVLPYMLFTGGLCAALLVIVEMSARKDSGRTALPERWAKWLRRRDASQTLSLEAQFFLAPTLAIREIEDVLHTRGQRGPADDISPEERAARFKSLLNQLSRRRFHAG